MLPTRLLCGLLLTVVLGATTYTCDPPPGTPLCQFPNHVKIAFIGTALATNYEPFVQRSGTWYRFSVEERLAGIASSESEVVAWVSLGSGAVEIGRKYFVHANRDENQSRYYMTSCGNTRPVEAASEDIEYLRKRQSGTFRPYISGSVLRNYMGNRYKSDSRYRIRGVPAASVILTRKDRTLPVIADENGEFHLMDVEPGDYKLTANAPGYAQFGEFTVHVPSNGCGVAQVALSTSASITGVILNHDGTPAAGIRVGLIDSDPAFENPFVGWGTGETDSRGQFSLTGLPSGRFLLGVNIDECERYPNAVPPTYYPGVTSRSEAAVVTVRPNEALNHLILRLPPPRKMRVVRVELKWPDGSVPDRAAVNAWLNKGACPARS